MNTKRNGEENIKLIVQFLSLSDYTLDKCAFKTIT